MTLLPRVTELTRQRVARELDDIGPAALAADTTIRLKGDNPELLDIARRCARDSADADKVMVGLTAFYQLLAVEARTSAPHPAFATLPKVSPESRDLLVDEIDQQGAERFTADAIDHMEQHNPELLQMAHNFASSHPTYLEVMQGFCLMYKALVVQSAADRQRLH